MQTGPVIEVANLVVEYGQGRARRRAVDGISFAVQPGECIGFIGANGAGKSSTIKAMMGFVFPESGNVRLFGLPAGDPHGRTRIGYLPEVALYYPFMKARELLQLYGGLHGMTSRQLRDAIPRLLHDVGLEGRGETLLRNFSKGMQQRLGIAQALISDPEVLILDEMSSGLDPLGRHDLRQVLLNLKQRGRTIFFSSHELTEVESLCDRVLIIHQGRLVRTSRVRELLSPLNCYEVVFRPEEGVHVPAGVAALGPESCDEGLSLTVGDVQVYATVLQELSAAGIAVQRASSRSRSLESYFIELVRDAEARGA